MNSELLKWLVSIVTSAAFISGVGYLFRDSIGKFLTKSIEHKFDTKLEKFKSEVREGEKELEQIRNYLSNVRTSRDSVLQSKRFESAENLIKTRKYLIGLSMAVQYMQMLNVKEIMKMGDDQRLNDFMEAITRPLKINEKLEEYNGFDKDTMKLYLSESTLKSFEIYESISLFALISLRFLSIPLARKHNILNEGEISKKIIEVIPASKEGFDKFGEIYIYNWHNYFYTDVLNKLRSELIGENNMINDTKSAERLALDFQKTKGSIKELLATYGLSQGLINEGGMEE
ncbi:hypothetical protein [Klebsiella pneumoniae]|uniref:Uncharacterized protein n=1 Tax=Klebsiella pneumoniae TaxID=573 RepID=A0A6A8ERA8_KLEPN|nr:hypothetical protein [Klebsiella pneumoniae]MBE4928506.1 hypothetical protein [Klebsiella pneumoniae]MBE4935405.1 hypothetical protein [Klebsiella pneumoniae]MDX7171595.1 hypothetical protein [Klebsiella pneumoniae]MDX7435548.1 hypothetical protein [Klebsiella pneumoniae]OZN62502.1 hypothetical protein CIT29_22750 [Klebsiella pneumoniae]